MWAGAVWHHPATSPWSPLEAAFPVPVAKGRLPGRPADPKEAGQLECSRELAVPSFAVDCQLDSLGRLRDERDTADGSKLVRAYSGGRLQRGGFSGQKARLAKRRRRASLKSIDH